MPVENHKINQNIKIKDYIFLSSMLFGLFFGAGNLIFPASLGQQSASSVWPAILGFCLTGVGLPLLGIVAMGISKSEGMTEMANHVGKKYSTIFTCALYLSIGPLFAIPRTATVSFSVGVNPLVPDEYTSLATCIFSAVFFAIVLFFSLRPSGILTWVGKILNPIFLIFLSVLAVTALINPMSSIGSCEPVGAYKDNAVFQGFLDGYNTMDALASLAFGIVLIQAIRRLGVSDSVKISSITVKSGIFSCALMSAIYVLLAVIGAQSRSVIGISEDGGEALYSIGTHYFGIVGGILLGIIITVACLKTAIGLITSCATTFSEIFPHSISYKAYTIIFCIFSFGIANIGLNKIIQLSLPVLMLLYPLTITLILLCIAGRFFKYDKAIFVAVTIPTTLAAILDFLNYLPDTAKAVFEPVLNVASQYLPLFSIGVGWLIPAAIGLIVGIIIHLCRRNKLA